MTSFTVNLSQWRDGSFYLYGGVCRFINSEEKYADADEFLIRQKLTSKMNIAGKQKAEGIHCGTGASHTTIQKTSDTVESDFVTSALHYLGYLLDELLRQSDIVKGLAAFDPLLILFKRPTEIALRHFEALYTTFLLRAWVTSADEPAYRYEYLELLYYLRSTYPPDFIFEESSQDLIEFLMSLEFLQTRASLLYLFKLCCLCITSPSHQFPAITVGNLNTRNFKMFH